MALSVNVYIDESELMNEGWTLNLIIPFFTVLHCFIFNTGEGPNMQPVNPVNCMK